MAFITVLAAWKAPSSLHLRVGSTRQPQQANSRNGPKKLDPSSLLQWNRPGSHARLREAYNLSSTRLNKSGLIQGIARWTLPEQSSKLADFSRKRVTHRP
ncbi:hypothetical protein TRIUR3_27528 [Triticum urartu]|uniref:Uncharacterized protein n=1 Tax=Triticum urartu TaxID=4572 RepID=M7ZDZ7_TRIUA|nr:hypothetical protein TRIUR3_27528 [Triticum urartu]